MKNLLKFFKSAIKLILRHPMTGACVIPLLADGQIVLVKRRDNGKWACPGGMIDWGENIPDTVKRELGEETGLELIKINRLVGVYSDVNRDPRFHSICVVVAADVQGTFKIEDQIEITEVKAFPVQDLPLKEMSHGFDQILQDYLNGKTSLT